MGAHQADPRRASPGGGLPGSISGVARLAGQSPVVVPALAAVALFVAWDTDQGGYPVTHWAPGGLIVLTLLGIAVGLVPLRVAEIPRAVLVSLGCLLAYTAWSFLSILWAGAPSDALEGADRTLLYLLVFALFASWRMTGAAAAVLVLVWTFALIGVAVFVVLHLTNLDGFGLVAALPGGRLVYPADYVNANAAQWLMGAFPAVLLARTPRLHPAMRGALAAGAVVLADVALLSLSRGSVFATAALLAAAFLLFPGRLRTFAVLMPVGLGVAVSLPFLLKVGDRLEAPETTAAAAHAAESAVTHAAIAIFAAAVLVGLAVTAACALEYNGRRWPTVRPRARRAVAVLAALTAVVGVGGAFTATGDPVAKVGHEWNTFTSPQGYGANSKGNRLISGLGSSRYDFYRVALDEFASHPLLGIGADNFEAQYLRKGHSDETPHYPHSVELRTLTETGLVGAALALVGLGAALVAARRALRRADALGRAAAAGALVGFGYWAVHGSVDWFFEYAGLGAQAFALLGIACALDPARAPVGRGAGATGGAWRVPRFTRGAAQRRILLGVPLAAMALAIAWALAVPWLTGLEEQRAAHIWEKAPATAYSELNSAASLDGLSPGPYLLAASIALRRGEVAHADHEFVLALTRAPEDEYATLERGAIASAQGETARSVRLLERAVALYPRGRLGHEALQYARTGQRVSLTLLNSVILKEGQELQ